MPGLLGDDMKAKWILSKESLSCYIYKCSNCGQNALELADYDYRSKYCPYCGAEMENPENERIPEEI